MIQLDPASIQNALNLYNGAITYLSNNSVFAQNLIGELNASPQQIGVRVTNVNRSQFIPNSQNYNGGLIIWNHLSSVAVTDISPTHPQQQPGTGRPDVPWTRERGMARVGELIFGKRSKVGQISPQVCLAHELGHAYQFISDPVGANYLWNNDSFELEELNVLGIEAIIVQELIESGFNETHRWSYYDQGHFPHDPVPGWIRGITG